MVKRTSRPCWCRCICHAAICAIQTKAGRCGGCQRDCNEPKPGDRPK